MSASIRPDHEHFICFDQLDLGFDAERPEDNNRLIGLLLASLDLNLAARDRGKKFFVAVFLGYPRTTKTLRQLMEKRFTTLLETAPDERVKWVRRKNADAGLPVKVPAHA